MYKMTEVIYKIYCKDKTITDCYVGSTNDFNKRCNDHNSDCNNKKSSKYNLKVYKYIREHKGMDNWIIEEIIECDEFNRYDAEVHYFLKLNATLNSRWPRRNRKQYYNDNKEHISEQRKQYYIANTEQILERERHRYIDNREQILERNRQYRIHNREQLSEKGKTKIECECGSVFRRADTARHYRSQKHKNYISTK